MGGGLGDGGWWLVLVAGPGGCWLVVSRGSRVIWQRVKIYFSAEHLQNEPLFGGLFGRTEI